MGSRLDGFQGLASHIKAGIVAIGTFVTQNADATTQPNVRIRFFRNPSQAKKSQSYFRVWIASLLHWSHPSCPLRHTCHCNARPSYKNNNRKLGWANNFTRYRFELQSEQKIHSKTKESYRIKVPFNDAAKINHKKRMIIRNKNTTPE